MIRILLKFCHISIFCRSTAHRDQYSDFQYTCLNVRRDVALTSLRRYVSAERCRRTSWIHYWILPSTTSDSDQAWLMVRYQRYLDRIVLGVETAVCMHMCTDTTII